MAMACTNTDALDLILTSFGAHDLFAPVSYTDGDEGDENNEGDEANEGDEGNEGCTEQPP